MNLSQAEPVQDRNIILGLASAVGVIFIWSGFIVFSRAGVTTSLTAYDITALRFMVAGTMVLPFLRSWWPSHLPLHAKILMSISGPGAIYSVLMYNGLANASAAYAGVFANGSLPIFTTIYGLFLTRQIPGKSRVIAISIIVGGGLLSGLPGMAVGGSNTFLGIALFLAASVVLAFYIHGLQHWKVTPRQALALVNLPSALIFLPLWFFFLPSGLAQTDLDTILFQAFYQGLGPGFVAVILFAIAAKHLGSTPTAGFSAVVPASAAILAIPVLGEIPTALEWTGIGVVTIGLALLVMKRD